MTDVTAYRTAYDAQLRTDAETPSAISVELLGPLRLVTFNGGRGFVTYADLADADAATLSGWVERSLDHFRRDPGVTRVEWKTRGHDRAPGLHEALVRCGFRTGRRGVDHDRRGEAARRRRCPPGGGDAASRDS